MAEWKLALQEAWEMTDPEERPKRIEIGRGALGLAAPYLKDRNYRGVLFVVDATTDAIAGGPLAAWSEREGLRTDTVVVLPNAQGDVAADEASLIQVILKTQAVRPDVLVAVGAGTLHDIARYAAYTTGKPFVSIPTAPSVDGFTSKGAPLIVRGAKTTIAAVGPEAIFADLDVLVQAPPALVAAGFGDMLGKYTSLFDWTFGSMTGGEPYSRPAHDLTLDALNACVRNAEGIGAGTEEGIGALTASLIQSGLAMLMFGASHPASGAEHHLSHYWEMTFLRQGRRQLLHGAKVGVACAEISALYRRIVDEGGLPLQSAEARSKVEAELANVPSAERLRALLRTVGGPATIEELGVERELFEESLRRAHEVRPNRMTMLRAYNLSR